MPKKAKERRDGIHTRKNREGYYGTFTDGAGRRVNRKLEGAYTMEQARQVLQSERGKALAIRKGELIPVSEETFATFAADFLKYQRKRISSEVVRGKISAHEYERQRGIIESHLNAFFGTMTLSLIRRVHVIRYIHARTGVVGDGTLIKEVNTLKSMFNAALDLEKITANPARRAPLPQAPKGRTRYLSVDEWKRVFVACTLFDNDYSELSKWGKLNKKRAAEGLPELVLDATPLPAGEQWLQHAVGLAVSLGTRRGELMHVSLPDIDLGQRTILLRKTKNGKPRMAFINDLAMAVLKTMNIFERQQQKNSGPLFVGINPPQLSTAFKRACKRAGVEDFSLHDLRHTFASHLRMSGADLHDLQVMLGHSDPRMTARYAHLSNEHLDRTAQRLNGVLSLP
jgi:integrase